MMIDIKIGDKYKSKNGLIGTIEEINNMRRLVVRDFRGKISQTISLRKVDLAKFERV